MKILASNVKSCCLSFMDACHAPRVWLSKWRMCDSIKANNDSNVNELNVLISLIKTKRMGHGFLGRGCQKKLSIYQKKEEKMRSLNGDEE